MFKSNPVLKKELRQRFRSFKGPLILFLYLLVIGGFILGFIYLNWRYQPMTFDPGRSREIFTILSVVQLVLLGFVTPGLTAGTISGERERQTLNVLLTTELSPTAIVIGKMISSCSFTLLLIIATVPLYSLVFLFGGVSPTQLWGVFGFYLVTMFLFGAVGMACSTFFKRTGVSTITSYGIVAFLGGGTAFLAAFIYEFLRNPEMPGPEVVPFSVQFLFDINPFVVLMRILNEGSPISNEAEWMLPYWGVYTTFYVCIGILLLIWSGRKLNPLRKTNQNKL